MGKKDQLATFVFEGCNVRGGIVSLDNTWQLIVARHNYPSAVAGLVGEASVASVLMASHLKGGTSLSMQIIGEGAIRLLVVQCSGDLRVRAMADWREPLPTGGLLGGGRLAVTLEPAIGERYQGIVPIVGSSMAQSLEAYFQRSEQLATKLWLSASPERAVGLMLQAIPGEDGQGGATGINLDSVLSEMTLLDQPDVAHPERFLREHFGAWDIRLHAPRALAHDCRCTSSHLGNIVRMLGEAEVNSLLSEQGMVELTCEFCNRAFRYGPQDARAALDGRDVSGQLLH